VQGGLAQRSWYHDVVQLDKVNDAELRIGFRVKASENG
jgi:hypothetical protein